MKVLIAGAAGQVGQALARSRPEGITAVAVTRAALDIADRDAVHRAVELHRPDLVINAAAYTAVDKAESDRDEARAGNALGPRHLAEAAAVSGARLIHLSTDFVFDGMSSAPYRPDDPPAPLGVYGATKLEGERAVLAALPGRALVLRTAWVYAAAGRNFLLTMLRLMREKGAVRVVADQIGTPTRAANLANAMWQVAHRPGLRGVLHFTDAGVASWFDVAVCIGETLRAADRIGDDVAITPVDTVRFPRPAPRPRCAVLDKHATWERLGWTPPHWRAGVIASTREILDA